MARVTPTEICERVGAKPEELAACVEEIAWVTEDNKTADLCTTLFVDQTHTGQLKCYVQAVHAHYYGNALLDHLQGKLPSETTKRAQQFGFLDADDLQRLSQPPGWFLPGVDTLYFHDILHFPHQSKIPPPSSLWLYGGIMF